MSAPVREQVGQLLEVTANDGDQAESVEIARISDASFQKVIDEPAGVDALYFRLRFCNLPVGFLETMLLGCDRRIDILEFFAGGFFFFARRRGLCRGFFISFWMASRWPNADDTCFTCFAAQAIPVPSTVVNCSTGAT